MTALRQHAPLAFLLLIAAASFGWILQLGFTDTDALADVAAARVDGFGGIWGELTSPLTDGLAGNNANFWRPTTMLQFAFLRGLFGWSAWGWQAWDLGLHLGCVVMVYAIVRTQNEAGALVAASVFAFHPLSIEVVPAVARSIDSLMCLLVLLSVWMGGKGRWKWALFWGALALGAKETALAGLPMVVVWMWALGHRAAAKRLATGFVAVTLAYLAMRHHVLNGIGGYYETETLQVRRVRQAVQLGPWELIAPGWSGVLGGIPVSWRFPSGAGLLGIYVFFGVRGWRRGDLLSALGVGLVLLPLGLYAVTGTYTRRLLYLPTVGLAISSVVLMGSLRGRVILGAWLLSLLPASPLLQRDQSWKANDAVTQAMTWDLRETYASMEPGTVVWIVDRPVRIDGFPERRRLWARGRTLNNAVAGYSLQAWADDQFRSGHIRFRTISFSEPVGALPTPQVQLSTDRIHIQRPKLRRTKLLKSKVWSRDIQALQMTLTPTEGLSGDYLLVSGVPESVLVQIP